MKTHLFSPSAPRRKRLGALLLCLTLSLGALPALPADAGLAEKDAAAQTTAAPERKLTEEKTYQQLRAALPLADDEIDNELALLKSPVSAYLYNPYGFAVPACNLATSWSMPDGQYLPGTPFVIYGLHATMGSIPGYTDEEGMIYAWGKMLGDDSMQCYVPLVFLSLDYKALPVCSLTLKATSDTGFATVFSGRSTDSIPVNAFIDGTKMQLVGRQRGWYQVYTGDCYAFVRAENGEMSTFGQRLFDGTLFPYEANTDDSLLGAGDRLDAFNALLENAFSTWGEEKSYWTMEQKAWFSQLAADFGQVMDGMDVNILPGEGDLTRVQAIEKAVDYIQSVDGAQLDLDWYVASVTFFYAKGDAENVIWRICFHPVCRTDGYFCVRMHRDGTLLDMTADKPTEADALLSGSLYDFDTWLCANRFTLLDGAYDPPLSKIPDKLRGAYTQWQADMNLTESNDDYFAQYDEAAERYGWNNYAWPLDVQERVIGGDRSVPDETDIDRETAGKMAVQALIDQYGQEALDALGDYTVLYTFFRTGTGTEYRWEIYIVDDADTMLNGYRVTITASGALYEQSNDAVIKVNTLEEVSNG